MDPEELAQTLSDIADQFSHGFLEIRQAMGYLESLINEIEEKVDGR